MLNLPKDNFVFLETNRFDRDNHRSFLFCNPIRVISCYKPDRIKDSFLELEDFVSRGFHAAGFISYEAGYVFEDSFKGYKDAGSNFPLIWFGIYKDPVTLRHREKIDIFRHKDMPYSIEDLRANISRSRYVYNIKRIKDLIRRGDTYQVNYTFKYRFGFCGSPFSFYEDLKAKQSVSYSAFIKTPEHSILSLSPELFFRKDKHHMEVRPMKGTIDRGRDSEEDRRNMKTLEESLKNRSENVMIVDLLRNDLGRVSRSGSVKTKKLFTVEQYETLLQMISIVKSSLKKEVALYDLFKAIFPSGSVTGAPKINTMKIINSLEKRPRHIYTGGIGFFAPKGKAVFNVAIRTVLIDHKTKKGEMGVGSGIVYDSDPYKEFEECKLKANFITQKRKFFGLIETILWRPGKGYFLLRHHLGRLALSARYFDFKFDKKLIIRKLKSLERSFENDSDYKVRLLLHKDGRLESDFTTLDKKMRSAKVRFSDKRTSSRDMFLYHKTTNRNLYDQEYEKWQKKGYFDIIFTNEKDQVTEGAISNIIIKKNRSYYTPPLECGLLNGVFRRHLLEKRTFPIREKILYIGDIRKADEIYMINSVRGMVKVAL
ncbi:aminodeoxychorismate synthase component I [Candidatus Omnitrophota bacterium]